MAFDLQKLISSSAGITVFSAVARVIPQQVGYALADSITRRLLANPQSPLVRGVRANQWVVHGGNLSRQALQEKVAETLRFSARAIFDLYHSGLNPHKLDRVIEFNPAVEQLINRPEFGTRGLVVVGVHTGNFDLFLKALTLRGLRPLLLTIPDPRGSQKVEFEIRRRTGMNLVPVSVGAIRQALRILQSGGVVVTGIDRPSEGVKLHPRFFGKPAVLPMHHIYLAVKSRAPILLMGAFLREDGRIGTFSSEEIEMENHPDAEAEMQINAERVLGVAEHFIRQYATQWSISLPVWPQVLDQVPS
jgi:lauroyl/myristoyl acyltransferase